MPEGPELHQASQFINAVCKGRIFGGKIVKSEVSRCDDVEWDRRSYTISASSRGKELKVKLTSVKTNESIKNEDVKDNIKPCHDDTLDILFNFGMSGRFDFCDVEKLNKHAHLRFFTKPDSDQADNKMVLSFVDYRRFGKWKVGADWSEDRGPCVMFEYPEFRKNVLNNIHKSVFNKPICEVLLNQKYFNGIGNYLRAEILYRSGIRPFECARSVFEKLAGSTDDEVKDVKVKATKVKVKTESADVLQMCNQVPLEVINLGATLYSIDDPEKFSKFTDWLQCYYNPKMTNMADHNKRTIWYSGDPGPLVPSQQKVRGIKRSSKILKAKSAKSKICKIKPDQEESLSPSKKLKVLTRTVTRKKLADAMENPGYEKQAKARKCSRTSKKSMMKGKETKSKTPGKMTTEDKKNEELKTQKKTKRQNKISSQMALPLEAAKAQTKRKCLEKAGGKTRAGTPVRSVRKKIVNSK